MSLRLVREIHHILIEGTRGSQRNPGEFRKSQNWIGPTGAPLSEAAFVPPPPEVVLQAMSDIETFLHARTKYLLSLKSPLLMLSSRPFIPSWMETGEWGGS